MAIEKIAILILGYCTNASVSCKKDGKLSADLWNRLRCQPRGQV